jgi:hypothetical protein
MTEPKYPRRSNRDGTFDSICPRCFTTIHSSFREEELSEHENRHVCETLRISERRGPLRQTPERYECHVG